MLRAFQVAPTDPQDQSVNRPFLPGRKVQIAANEAVIITEGHPRTFRIRLELPPATVDELIQRAMALVPGQPGPSAYPPPPNVGAAGGMAGGGTGAPPATGGAGPSGVGRNGGGDAHMQGA